MIKIWSRKDIIELWKQGYSASRIKAKLGLDVTVRQIQPIGSEHGNRKQRYAHQHGGRLEQDQAFVKDYRSIIEELLIRRGQDPYGCTLCGRKGTKKMTIHHTKYEDATIEDLVFACWSCQHQYNNHGLA